MAGAVAHNRPPAWSRPREPRWPSASNVRACARRSQELDHSAWLRSLQRKPRCLLAECAQAQPLSRRVLARSTFARCLSFWQRVLNLGIQFAADENRKTGEVHPE